MSGTRVKVKVAEDENKEGIKIPTENDNSLKLETVLSTFPDSFALAYKKGKSNTWTVVEKKNEKFIPPQGGWGTTKYVCVRGKKIKFNLTNLGAELTREKLQKYLESYGIVEVEKFDKKNKTASVTIKFVTDTHSDDMKTQQHRFIAEEVVETDREKFTKRSGTTNLGHEFEELTMASLLLNLMLDEDVRDFRLSSNDVEFGSFDDIVADIELTNGDVRKYAIQLKYKNDPKHSLKNHLTCVNGEFSIQKYCNDFMEMTEHTKCHNLILFTNLKFNMKQGELLYLDDTNIKLEIVEEKSPEAFGGGLCYKFNSDISDQRKKFFDKFFLFPNQPNIQKIKQNLEKKLTTEFFSKNTVNHYLEFISEWNKKVHKKRLNKSFMKQLIALQVLASSIKSFPFENKQNENDKISLVKQAILNFSVTVVEKIHFENVKKIWESETANANEIEKIISEFQLRKLSDDEKRVSALWIMNKCPLIITKSDTSCKVISLCPEKYFILLKNNDCEISVQSLKAFTKLTDFEPNSEIYKNITKSFQCSIQGKQALNLEDLIKQCKSFENTVTINELIQMVDGPLTIGKQETILDIYIDRLVTKLTIRYNFFDKIDKDTLVIVSCQGKENLLKDRLKNFSLMDIDHLNKKSEMEALESSEHEIESFQNSKKKTVYFSKTQCTRVTFDGICRKNSDKKKYHHFRILEDEALEWMYSNGEISDLQKYKTDSSFLKETDLINAEGMVNVITADPGMGKTELMKKFSGSYSSSFWTILVPAKNWLEFLKLDCSTENFLKIVFKNTCKTKFEEDILVVMKNSKRITFIWDGLDELSNTYVDIAIKLIDNLVKKGFIQWISCRKHLEDKLEKKFNVLSRSIKKFDKDEQSNYICRRFNSNKEINLEEVVHKIENYIDSVQYNEILGIPLQIFMLTELLLNNPILLNTLLNEVFPITDLYQHFIDMKFKIFLTEKNKLKEKSSVLQSMIIYFLKTFHQKAALLITLEQQFLDKLNINSNLEISRVQDIYDIGIITGNTDNENYKFLHYSYAEYLAALYLYEHCDKFNISIKEYIFHENYQNIRFMFDLLLAKNCPAHLAVLYKNMNYLKCCQDYYSCKDEGGRNPLQIACAWGPRFPLLETIQLEKCIVIDDQQADMVNLSNSQHYDEMLHLLFRHNSVEDKDMLFHLNSIEYADLTLSLKPFTIFLKEKYDLPFHTLKNFKDMSTVLYYSIKFNYASILRGLQNIPFLNLIKNCNNILHMASENNLIDCIKVLLTHKNYRLEINNQNQTGTTPIYIAAEKGYYEMVKYLGESGADINIQNHFGWVPIHIATLNGHIEVVKLLVNDLKTNVNTKTKNRITPIHLAAGMGYYEIVKYLVESGADVNIQDQDGAVPIHYAAKNGHIQVVKYLSESKADVNIQDQYGRVPIHYAAKNGHMEVLKYLSESGADVNIQDQYGWVPIHYTAQNGHIEVVKLLVNDLKTNVNIKTKNRITPIYLAAGMDYYEIVKYLAESGADVNIQNQDGWVPIHTAALNGNIEVVKLLVNDLKSNVNAKTRKGSTPIHLASVKGECEVVKYLAESGAGVDMQDENGDVPIHKAAQNGHIKVVKLLVNDLKTNVNAKTKRGCTPILLAAGKGHHEVVKYLVESGADVNIQDQVGTVPIHYATQEGHIEVVKLLVNDLNANVNARTNGGFTPIYLASQKGYYEIVKYLTESGADVNIQNYNGDVPIHIAAKNGHIEVIKLLVNDLKTNVNAKNKKGFTPICIAAANNHYELVNFLLESGANVNIPDQSGKLPLHYAAINGHIEVVKLLVNHQSNVNAKTEIGITTIFVAYLNGHDEVVEYLTIKKRSNCTLL